MAKKIITDLNLKGKKALIRVDFNVPMKDGVITDENRIVQALKTINYAINEGAKVILFSHLGRVKTEEDKAGKSLAPVAKRLAELLGKEVKFVPVTRGKELEDAIDALQDGEVLMFENTRFEDIDGKKESKNDPELGKYWASLGDVFINDAFGTAHRAHASNVGIASCIKESALGFLLEKEVKYLGEAVDNPVRPFVAILGGAKVSDKIDVIERLLQVADKIIIGGGMSYTFTKALGGEIGQSLLEDEKLDYAKDMMARANGKIILPVDCKATTAFDAEAPFEIREFNGANAIKPEEQGLDIGPKSIELFKKELEGAKTVVWNGPMGVFEFDRFAEGTIAICDTIANLEGAKTIIGGGDSAAAAIKFGYEEKISHISTGGGASLEYLEGKVLPGLAAVQDK